MGDQSTFSTSENHEPEKILKKRELLGNDPVYALIHEIPVLRMSPLSPHHNPTVCHCGPGRK